MEAECLLVDEVAATGGLVIGVATLNLPASLNALTIPLIRRLSEALTRWEGDQRVACVVLQGAGGKAFCAGGDVRYLFDAACQSRLEGAAYPPQGAEFFIAEYQLDYQIHTYAKPLLCLGHGIVMGGGLGLMVGASHRVVTSNTKLAMPEITIGLFPDVGGTYFLPRLPGKTGLYLALSGTRLSGADSLYAGLADFLLDPEQLPGLLPKLATLPWSSRERSVNDQLLNQLLHDLSRQAQAAGGASELAAHRTHIDRLCSAANVHDFAVRWAEEPALDAWMEAGKRTFFNGSPTSAALIFEQARRGVGISLADAFRFELNLAVQCTAHADFVTGVRALLIDKDHAPQWQPRLLTQVDQHVLASYLAPLWSEHEHPLRHLGEKRTL